MSLNTQAGDTRATARRQFTITVPPELGSYIEELSAETGMNKSAVVSQVLADDRERRKERLLREGYEEMAPYDRELLQEFEHVDREDSWPEY
jgi:predicted transcriptional regulator